MFLEVNKPIKIYLQQAYYAHQNQNTCKKYLLSPSPTWPNIFSDREQSKTNRNDENATYDYLSEYLQMCFQIYEDSSRLFLNILQTLCK